MSHSAQSVVSKQSARHCTWGSNCDAWSLLSTPGLSIKQERMPEGAEEILHFHHTAQQFFFVLKGKAVFEVEQVLIIVHEGQGIHIEPGKEHRLMNRDEGFLEFLVCSQPTTNNDRTNIV